MHILQRKKKKQFLDEVLIKKRRLHNLNNQQGDDFMQTTVTLNNDQIKVLPSTPAILVPATEIIDYNPALTPTQIFRPIAAYATIKTVVPYDNDPVISAPYLLLGYSSDWANDASEWASVFNALTAAGSWFVDFQIPVITPITEFGVRLKTIQGQPINGDWYDNALVLACRADSGNFTGGNAANTLKVTVHYSVVDL